jgi:CRP/FNR family transcriptional regulator, cyclic AMP receptor protein
MLRRDAKTALLRQVPLFADCSKAELRQLARIADEVDLRTGTVLTREGRRAREFFVIVDGTVRVSKNGRTLADLGPGSWVGEIALLTRQPRTATTTATSPLKALVIVDSDFRRTLEEMPSIAMKVLSSVAERMSDTLG